ncbi:DUF192 domain-containing protein [Halobacteria archaeon AArc-dxtr1]|nr:DUF192 domain-containing protein [Halobacteria archaeon AArc-dxtr1]
MKVVHESDDGEQIIASKAETADGILTQGLGLMFRRSLPAEYALAFRFDRAKTRSIHMLFVFVPLDVIWVREGVVERVERLAPWRGFARAEADLILELPAGAAAGVSAGDRIRLEEA